MYLRVKPVKTWEIKSKKIRTIAKYANDFSEWPDLGNKRNSLLYRNENVQKYMPLCYFSLARLFFDFSIPLYVAFLLKENFNIKGWNLKKKIKLFLCEALKLKELWVNRSETYGKLKSP